MVADVQETKRSLIEIKEELKEQRREQEQEQRLANTFLSIAHDLMASNNKHTSNDASEEEFFVTRAPAQQELFLTPPSQEQEAEEVVRDEPPDHPDHTSFTMRPRHATLSNMWGEWHGEGQFYD